MFPPHYRIGSEGLNGERVPRMELVFLTDIVRSRSGRYNIVYPIVRKDTLENDTRCARVDAI